MYSNISQIDYTNYSNLLGQISIKGKTPFQIIDFLKLDIFEIPRLQDKPPTGGGLMQSIVAASLDKCYHRYLTQIS